MIDFGKQKIKINCPSCNKFMEVTLSQVSNGSTVKCNGCNINIQLKDSNNSVKSGMRNINNAFKDLEKTLKKFGK